MKSKLKIVGIESLSEKAFEVGLSVTYVLFDEFSYRIGFKYNDKKGSMVIQRTTNNTLYPIDWKYADKQDYFVLLEHHINTKTKLVDTILSGIDLTLNS
jgi:hypothetical protein